MQQGFPDLAPIIIQELMTGVPPLYASTIDEDVYSMAIFEDRGHKSAD